MISQDVAKTFFENNQEITSIFRQSHAIVDISDRYCGIYSISIDMPSGIHLTYEELNKMPYEFGIDYIEGQSKVVFISRSLDEILDFLSLNLFKSVSLSKNVEKIVKMVQTLRIVNSTQQ